MGFKNDLVAVTLVELVYASLEPCVVHCVHAACMSLVAVPEHSRRADEHCHWLVSAITSQRITTSPCDLYATDLPLTTSTDAMSVRYVWGDLHIMHRPLMPNISAHFSHLQLFSICFSSTAAIFIKIAKVTFLTVNCYAIIIFGIPVLQSCIRVKKASTLMAYPEGRGILGRFNPH